MSDRITYPQSPYAVHARCADCDWSDDVYTRAKSTAKNADRWEIYWSPAGGVWHREIKQVKT